MKKGPRFTGAFVLVAVLASPAFAQVICNDLGTTRYCRDPATGYTSATPLSGGSTTIIRNSDGSRTTVNSLDGGTTLIREPNGARTTINQLDGSTVIRNPDGSHSTITPLGGGTVFRDANGGTSTVVPLGGVGPAPGTGLNSGYGGLNSNNAMPGAGRPRCVQMGTSVSCD